jgi:hypothetical protein
MKLLKNNSLGTTKPGSDSITANEPPTRSKGVDVDVCVSVSEGPLGPSKVCG